MKRLIEKIVFRGFVMACRRATWPTRRSPSFVNATTDGVVRPPSAFGMTTGSPPSITATTEFVVPSSMPMTFAIRCAPFVHFRGSISARSGCNARAFHGCPYCAITALFVGAGLPRWQKDPRRDAVSRGLPPGGALVGGGLRLGGTLVGGGLLLGGAR